MNVLNQHKYVLCFGTKQKSRQIKDTLNTVIKTMWASYINKDYDDALILKERRSELLRLNKTLLTKVSAEHLKLFIVSNLKVLELYQEDMEAIFEYRSLPKAQISIDDIRNIVAETVKSQIQEEIKKINKSSSKKFLNIHNAAAFLGVTESAFYLLRKRKNFPTGIKFSDRNTVFSSEELATWAENQRNANLDKEGEQC